MRTLVILWLFLLVAAGCSGAESVGVPDVEPDPATTVGVVVSTTLAVVVQTTGSPPVPTTTVTPAPTATPPTTPASTTVVQQPTTTVPVVVPGSEPDHQTDTTTTTTTPPDGGEDSASDDIVYTTTVPIDFVEVVWRHRIEAGFGSGDCPAVAVSEIPAGSYTGRLLDSHFHMPHLPDSPPGAELGEPDLDGFEQSQYADWTFDVENDPIRSQTPVAGRNVTYRQLACLVRSDGTGPVFAFFPVFPHIQEQSLDLARRTMLEHPDEFIPFIMPPGAHDIPPTVDGRVLEEMVSTVPGLFAGYGEIGLYAIAGRSETDFPPDAPIFQGIYPVAREHGLVIYLHPGNGQVENLAAALGANPDIRFVVHGDEVQNAIGDLMDRYPNIAYTVDALYGDQYLLRPEETIYSFLAATDDFGPLLEVDLSMWKQVIEEHPGRFMWGTDRGGRAVWTYDPRVSARLIDYGRAFIAGLDPAVQESFAYRNAERLIAGDPVPTPASTTTVPPTTTVPAPTALSVDCTFDETDRRASCGSVGGNGGSRRWTSNLGSGWSGGERYEPTLAWGEPASEMVVSLERCANGVCETASTTIDLSGRSLGDCPAAFEGWFTTFPLPDLSAIYEVGPPFRIIPDDYKGHGYFRVPDGQNAVEVRMPADAVLVDAAHFIGESGGEPQYSLTFRTSCEGLSFLFDHVGIPVEAIADLIDWAPTVSSAGRAIGPLELSEGDLIGTSIGTVVDGNAFLDFGVNDTFARWPTPKHPNAYGRFLTAVCMYDFFDEVTAAYLRANQHTGSTMEPGLCPRG